MSKIITTKSGHEILIDEEDWDKVKDITWYVVNAPKTKYVMGAPKGYHGVGKRIYHLLHRLIMDAPKGMDVDHIDGNGLNNQKDNLRVCTRMQNLWNKHTSRGSSQYKGVSWVAPAKKWTAIVSQCYKCHYLGLFQNEIDAALAYNEKAQELFGEFACLNVIPE